jgi:hypothetical protein
MRELIFKQDGTVNLVNIGIGVAGLAVTGVAGWFAGHHRATRLVGQAGNQLLAEARADFDKCQADLRAAQQAGAAPSDVTALRAQLATAGANLEACNRERNALRVRLGYKPNAQAVAPAVDTIAEEKPGEVKLPPGQTATFGAKPEPGFVQLA